MSSYQVGLLHPSYILRGAWGEEVAQIETLKRVRRLIDGEEWPDDNPNNPPPGVALFPTVEEMWEWYEDLWMVCPACDGQPEFGCGSCSSSAWQSALVACDIECAGDHLRCVGFATARGSGITIHFRTKGGDPFWSPTETTEVAKVTWALLADSRIPKVFHNGQSFDTVILERNGFEVNGYARDTMIEGHLAYPEIPKKLSYMSKLYIGVDPDWKGLVKDEDEGENK